MQTLQNKLEGLVGRFEGLLNRFEIGQPGVGSDVVSQVLTEASTVSAAPVKRLHKAVKGFNEALLEPLERWQTIADKHSNKKLIEATRIVRESFAMIGHVIQAITESKQTKSEVFAEIIGPLIKKVDKDIGNCSKDMAIKNHCKALLDGVQLLQLSFMDDPYDMGKEFLNQIDFYGNKVLNERKDPDTEWYTCYRREICQKYFDHLVEAYGTGMPFKLDGTDFKDNFTQIHAGGTTSAQNTETKKEEKKEEKHEEKKVEKKEAKKPADKPKNPPTKVKRGKMWDISFYENETIEFKAEEIENGNFFMVTSCVNTNFIIHGKFNNISLTGCKNCAVVVDNVIASVEIIKGDGIKVQVNEMAPQVIVDRSNKTGIYLNDKSKDLKINTTCSTSTFIYFPLKEADRDGNDDAALGIPETYVTTIKNDQLVTEPLDMTE